MGNGVEILSQGKLQCSHFLEEQTGSGSDFLKATY